MQEAMIKTPAIMPNVIELGPKRQPIISGNNPTPNTNEQYNTKTKIVNANEILFRKETKFLNFARDLL